MIGLFICLSQQQVKRPDRLVKSGINFAYNQNLFDKFNDILNYTAQDLINNPINLQIQHLFNLKIKNDDPNDPQFGYNESLFDWTVQNINLKYFLFDRSASTVSLIEPSQRIKIHVSNFHARITFVSNFTTNQDLLPYTELRDVELRLANVSLTITIRLNTSDAFALNLKVEQIQINAKSSDVNLICPEQGIFMNEVSKFFEDSKDFTLQNINQWLTDVNTLIQNKVDLLMSIISISIMRCRIYEDPYAYVFLGLNKPINQQYSPIIYDNFLSVTHFGTISDFGFDIAENVNYIPLYLNIPSTMQIFVSLQSLNQLYTIINDAHNRTMSYGGDQLTKKLINKIIPNFDQSFPNIISPKVELQARNALSLSIAAGDLYVEDNTFQLVLYNCTDQSQENRQFQEIIRLEVNISVIIISVNMSEGMIFYYKLKNYNFKSATLISSSNPKFNPSMSLVMDNFNNGAKLDVRGMIDAIGLNGTKSDPSKVFGKTYAKFWESFFNNSQVILKHEYFQIQVKLDNFTDYTLFTDMIHGLFKAINSTSNGDYAQDFEQTNQRTLRALQAIGSNTQAFSKYKNHKNTFFKSSLSGNTKLLENSRFYKAEKSYVESITEHASNIYNEISQMKNILYDNLYIYPE
ncbi:UNKNOWN [Stylonychia lemnae]|uniref:Uncharacterized protein n=1 Tax=Stylonychia lemnae TaxID=5949 RepID=A0A077ZPQ7_STYLE|nr:UNKNOWN [Stylonychia lemnae]|eukprot:CDW71444.1 UNKNOWN [Stylonychia lemnae]